MRKGWHYDSARHALARKGIESRRVNPTKLINYLREEEKRHDQLADYHRRVKERAWAIQEQALASFAFVVANKIENGDFKNG